MVAYLSLFKPFFVHTPLIYDTYYGVRRLTNNYHQTGSINLSQPYSVIPKEALVWFRGG